jgi:hypothetical protein
MKQKKRKKVETKKLLKRLKKKETIKGKYNKTYFSKTK